MNDIPKIIHQIWSGINEPLPRPFKILGDTWKRDYPDSQYELWDNNRINSFIQEHYPQYWDIYCRYPFNIQRWDAIRYLILDKIGGIYVDFDYESIKSMYSILKGKTCCFAGEKIKEYNESLCFNNALMASTPNHSFMQTIIEYIFSIERLKHSNISKKECVFNTTGPFALMKLYNELSEYEKSNICIIPAKYVTPFNGFEACQFRLGERTQDLEDCLDEAYAVHYYCSNWATNRQ